MGRGVPNKKYTGEFKQQVIADLMENHLSYNAAARKYGVCDHHRIQSWERIYLEEGYEGLYQGRRGRTTKEKSVTEGRPKKLNTQVEEDLIAEVQRLRAENDYLKKLNALVQEKEISAKKRNQKS